MHLQSTSTYVVCIVILQIQMVSCLNQNICISPHPTPITGGVELSELNEVVLIALVDDGGGGGGGWWV